MGFECGIIGLPNVGKSTLFNALTESNKAEAANYPFATIEPNIGRVAVPDERLNTLSNIGKSEKTIPTYMDFVDIAGLVKGASTGEGLGNKFLANIREVDAIAHVVRCFEDENITHVEGNIDPLRDAELIETELLLADLETLEKSVYRLNKLAKKEKKAQKELNIVLKLKAHCDEGKMARTFNAEEEEFEIIKSLFLLTRKPILYVANVDENEILKSNTNLHVKALYDLAKRENNKAIRLCGKIEQEIATLDEDEKDMFMEEYNLNEPGLNKLIHTSFKLLGLETYFTGGPTEVRAWTIKKGATAPEAAGEIHTDFQRGFIKAEVIKYEDLLTHGSEKKVKDAGLAQLEGKDYIVRDGDCIFFHFNV